MLQVLRFVGLLNVAVWLGGAVFFTFGAAPAFFSTEMKDALGPRNAPFFTGYIAQLVIERYYRFNLVCSAIALAHLLAEHLYLGRAVQRVTAWLWVGLVAAGLLGGLVLQPRMREWHRVRYSQAALPAQRERAIVLFRFWHGFSQVLNLAALGGLGVYLWRVSQPGDAPRFVSSTKFRS